MKLFAILGRTTAAFVRPTDGGGPEPNWEQVPPTRNATCGMKMLRTGHSRAHLWKRKARGRRAPHAKLRVIVRSPTRWLVPPTSRIHRDCARPCPHLQRGGAHPATSAPGLRWAGHLQLDTCLDLDFSTVAVIREVIVTIDRSTCAAH